MGWFRKAFLYREDYNPALQGLRGVAVLWFFHWSFYAQFDPAKLSRITGDKPWLASALEAARLAMLPAEIASVAVAGAICGFLLLRERSEGAAPGRQLRDAFARIYGLYVLAALPSLSYTGTDLRTVAKTLVFLETPPGFPPFTAFLGVVLACKMLVCALSALDILPGSIAPPDLPGMFLRTDDAPTRILSHPVLRYFGAVALPFFLIHTTWGFRLSRSILQGEIHSVQAIAAHYLMSLAFSAVFAGFLHIFFERPCFLRNSPAAGRKPGSDIQGVSP